MIIQSFQIFKKLSLIILMELDESELAHCTSLSQSASPSLQRKPVEGVGGILHLVEVGLDGAPQLGSDENHQKTDGRRRSTEGEIQRQAHSALVSVPVFSSLEPGHPFPLPPPPHSTLSTVLPSLLPNLELGLTRMGVAQAG